MNCKECVIGVINQYEDTKLATVSKLKEHMEDFRRLNGYIRELCGDNMSWWDYREWAWKQYCDKRVHTDLTRFDYCPYCGKKIDWRKMKHEID